MSKDIVFVFCSPAATSFGVPYYLCFVQSSTHEKGLSQQELHEALTGQSQKTPEGSKHKSKVRGDGGHGQSHDGDVAVTTPEKMESRWSTPGAAADSVTNRGQRQRSASTHI